MSLETSRSEKMRQETGSEFWVRICRVSQNEVRKKK